MGCHPMSVHIYTQTIYRTTQITNNVEECEFYPGICLTTEEKARKNLSQGKKNLSQVNKNLSQINKNLSQVNKNLSQVIKTSVR